MMAALDTWLASAVELMLIVTIVCCAILLMHSKLLKRLGAHYTYLLWLIVPLLFAVELAQLLMPQLYASILPDTLAEPMQRFTVVASNGLTSQLGSLEPLVWVLTCIYVVGVAWQVSKLVYQQGKQSALLQRATDSTANSATSAAIIDTTAVHSMLANANNAITVLVSEQVTTPMLMGLVKPVIVLPTSFYQLSKAQQQAVLEHELFHFKRKDPLCNGLAYLLASLLWFNPITWMAYKRFRDDQELSCDAQVTADMSAESKIAYSRALLAYSQHAPMSMLQTHYGDKTILKERILQMKQQHGKRTGMLLGLTAVLGLSAMLINPTVVAGGDNKSHVAGPKAGSVYPKMRIEPKYPAQAAKEGINGFVQMSFDITPAGMVTNVAVIKSSSQGMFDASAVEALRQWQYETSAKGQKGAQVQIDFVMHQPDASVERIEVYQAH
ncbi:M56 family metallopeptidase [Shewanella sp. WXL01]|uniref:M56 family metallopeptidase n=1 Tax=Shewanella sp. WXL01 TaxID=2709721 RepID=UPI001438628A|nr:M56 family metallopeptidase [Shewanella sp. WXL01]NKF49235.1 M56 family metallopeptidase [Shewanella sp. WXL01]